MSGLGRTLMRWTGHVFGQVLISLAGTACLALLSNLYLNGTPAPVPQPAAARTLDLSSATIAAQTFAPEETRPDFDFGGPAAEPASPPEHRARKTAAVAAAAAEPEKAPPLPPAVVLNHAPTAARDQAAPPAPPLRLTAMTARPAAADRDSSGIVTAADGVVRTVAGWGGWLTRLPSHLY
jgi:hypothetical protein